MSDDSPSGADAGGLEEDFADLFEAAPCGYLSADPSGRLLQVNATLADWLGQPKDALIGRRFQDLLTLPGRIFYDTHFAPLLRIQGVFNEVALDLVGAEGRTLSVLVNAVERRDAEARPLFVRISVFNATDRRRYEHELLAARREAEAVGEALRELNHTLEARVEEAVAQRLEAEEALRQSQKMEAIGQLTGGVAHDFNNLLTVILGGLEAVQKHAATLPPGPEVQRIQRGASMAAHGAERAATLTARLLAFARRQPLDPRPIEPARLVTGLADLLQRTLGEGVRLETVTGAGLWRALADPGELENALLNLAVNARDAMPEGGRLTVETSNAFLDEAYAAAIPEPVPPGQYVLIAVSDTGHGMDGETLARVFEPFFTTKEVGRGTGLGLSQVYGFARQTGGHVRIYSEPGLGTTVKLYLPRAGDDLPIFAPEVAAHPIDHRGREAILLVEDHEALRGYAAGVLTELGYRVRAVADGAQALRALDEGQAVDLLFTDVVLPGELDGRRLAEAALLRRPGLRVLYTTGYSRNAIVHNGRLDPGVELIVKPFSAAALAAKVRAVLDR